MSPSRTVLALAAVALLGSAATACGDAGGLRGAGPTPTAISPARLWPQLTPASSPAWDLDEADTETIKGVTVPGDDVRQVDPVALVRAEIEANPDDYEGDKAPYRDTVRRIADCARGVGTTAASRCPVLQPYYRDLTGDGRPDLTLGFRLLPGDLTAVRVYTADRHRLVRVMAWEDAVSSVELAGRSVIIRSPSDLAEYEYRLQWTWDPERKAMLLTHDEMLRSDGRAPGPGSSPSSSPSPSPSRSASGR
ncbi:hypothetical protein [Streptomyces sp. A012304]|uniref:hypothetical protein n=1 Tax=Streptomyces sp. A012304 TaxID=375446 RepID=UPI00222F5296|nr:hypothetical protein [Streptomyces sp. A012304]GKQ40288.1 lipoprotein [Streptomyces sp. A012304]